MFELKWKCNDCGAGFLTQDLLSMHNSVFHKPSKYEKNEQANNDVSIYNKHSEIIKRQDNCAERLKGDTNHSNFKVVRLFHKFMPRFLENNKSEVVDGHVTEEEYLDEFSDGESNNETSVNEASQDKDNDTCILVVGENGMSWTELNDEEEDSNKIDNAEYLNDDEHDSEESDIAGTEEFDDRAQKNKQTDGLIRSRGVARTPRKINSNKNIQSVIQFKCKRCDEIFGTKHERRLHMETHAKDLRFFCKLCGRGFRKNQGLMLHLNVHTTGSKHQCPFCHNFYRTDRYLKEHIKLHMPEEYKFQCAICPKLFAHKTAFKYHMHSHYNIIPYVCNLCGKGYRQKPSLDAHMNMHAGTRPFTCDTCGAGFRMKHTLRDHQRLHANERPFVCKYPGCDKSYIIKTQLKTHMMKHEGVKRHPCTHAGCDKSFLFESHRQRHERTKHRLSWPDDSDDEQYVMALDDISSQQTC